LGDDDENLSDEQMDDQEDVNYDDFFGEKPKKKVKKGKLD
jgi:U3 small nucleolar ribonucleoprotein component